MKSNQSKVSKPTDEIHRTALYNAAGICVHIARLYLNQQLVVMPPSHGYQKYFALYFFFPLYLDTRRVDISERGVEDNELWREKKISNNQATLAYLIQ